MIRFVIAVAVEWAVHKSCRIIFRQADLAVIVWVGVAIEAVVG